jgi:DNA-directed RNA polymerase subunit RPC12/RpoP
MSMAWGKPEYTVTMPLPDPPERGPSQIIPLAEAVLCANCDHLSDARGDECPKCGSKSLMSLARALDPKPLPTDEENRRFLAGESPHPALKRMFGH